MNQNILEALGELEREQQADDAAEQPAGELSPAFKARLLDEALIAVNTAPVVELRPSRWIVRTIIGLAAIAAATMFLWVQTPASLPRYELSLTGGERGLRSGEPKAVQEKLQLAEGGAVLIELRPDEPVSEKITLRAYLYTAGKLHTWDAAVDVSAEGAVRSELAVGPAQAAKLGGAAELVLVLARSDKQPSLAELEGRLSNNADLPREARVFRRQVEPAR